ncbi:MAG: nicotinate-nucleotide adenylyltransferase [Syntrophobacteraceae bacterium]|nr:nicotinate-nucleotide adenylyltransferase [Syntrophobacteraceae bacterium]
MPLRLGILGGTFDPVHLGHLRAAEEAMEFLGLDQICFVPVALPPHKLEKNIVSFESRWRMLQLAINGNPRFCLSDMELRLPGKSYTVNSLKNFGKENPGTELFFLVGYDAFFEMDTWYEYKKIFALADIVVLCRPECRQDEILEFATGKVSGLYEAVPGTGRIGHPELCSIYNLLNTRMDISSTRIRELAAQRRSIRYLVPDSVWSYIAENALYQKGSGGPVNFELARNGDG